MQLLPMLSAVVAAHAADPSAPALTLMAALERAAEQNPALAAQRYEERAADALVEQAGVRPNPTLDVELENVLGTGAVQGVRRLEATVQASQVLERGDKRARRIAVAEREREFAAQGLAVRRAEVRAATAIAFVETLAAQHRVALAEEPVRLARAMLAAVETRVREGMASPVDTARARAAVAAAQVDLARARAALAAARTALAATWGGHPDEVGVVHGRIHVPDTLPDGAGFSAALDEHPRLQAQAALVAARRAALALAEAQAVQDITVGGGVRFLREGSDATFVAGVSVPLPVRHRNQGNIRAARESLAGAEQADRAIASELRLAFTAAWQELEATHATAVSLRREALPPALEAEAVVRRAYDEGQLPLIDVLDAQRALVAIQREILDAEAACAGALVRVEGLAHPTFTLTAELLASE
jgi:cobalt-zinc-cadmium efflux system outer membrane protein